MLYLIPDLESLFGPYFGRIKYSLVLLILFIPSKPKVYYMTLSYMHIHRAM